MCKLFTHRGRWRVPVICATRVRKSYITNSMETSCLKADSRIKSTQWHKKKAFCFQIIVTFLFSI